VSGIPGPGIAALLLVTAAQAGAALLAASGLRHGRRRRELVHHLRRHRVVPDRSVALVSRAVPVVSVAVGGAALALPTLAAGLAPSGWLPVQRLVTGAQGLVFLGFLGYLVLLHRRSPAESCGCLGASDERPGTATVRAGGLALVALATAVAAGPLTGISGWPSLYLLATVSGALAGVGWAARAGRREPDGLRRVGSLGRLA
jgi:hypothetical protein